MTQTLDKFLKCPRFFSQWEWVLVSSNQSFLSTWTTKHLSAVSNNTATWDESCDISVDSYSLNRFVSKIVFRSISRLRFVHIRRISWFRRDLTVMEAYGVGFRQLSVLLFCVTGIWSAYIYQGVLQETV